jgi:hypothetical protein
MTVFHHDFETRSAADLGEVGLDRYASSPTTRALMLSWSVDDRPIRLWQAHQDGPEIPEEVRELLLDPVDSNGAAVVRDGVRTPLGID